MDPLKKPVSRRDVLKVATAGGFTLGSAIALGNVSAVKARVQQTVKVAGAKDIPSVCPYCAVGCGILVSVKDGKVINVEGNPNSPINEGNLCPKGAASFQMATTPLRVTKVRYRAPGATQWEEKPLDWAMERIAQLTKETRDRTFTPTWKTKDASGNEVDKEVNHTMAIGSLGGATMDNEWNYVQLKLMRALGVVNIENQARI
jgi:formate dehydrogenase major subunit